MLITKKLPARRQSSGEGATSTRVTKPTAPHPSSQSVENCVDVLPEAEVIAAIQRLMAGEDISVESPALLRAVLDKLWCSTSPAAPPPPLRWWRTRRRSGSRQHNYFVEARGRVKRLGLIPAITSQWRFRSRLAVAADGWIPCHAEEVWVNVVRCLLRVFEDRAEVPYV